MPPPAAGPAAAAAHTPPAAPPPPDPAPPFAAAGGDLVAATAARWVADIKPKLKGLARALYSNTTLLGERGGAFCLGVSNEATRIKCEDHRKDVEAVIAGVVGAKVTVQLVIHTGPDDHDGSNVVPLQRAHEPALPDEEIDLDELIDAPPEAAVSPIERLAQAFPGSQLVEE